MLKDLQNVNTKEAKSKKKEVLVVEEKKESGKQLRMDLYVRLPSGKGKDLKILIDTGAEANLIRKGILDDNEFDEAKEPMFFATVTGEPIEGGRRVVETTLSFQKFVGWSKRPIQQFVDAQFYEVDLKVDAILGNLWLTRERIGVFPHLQALAKIDENYRCSLLRSTCNREKKGKPRKMNKTWYWNRRRVDQVTIDIPRSAKRDKLNILMRMKFKLPKYYDVKKRLYLHDEELELIQQHLDKLEENTADIGTIFMTRGDCSETEPRVEELRAKLQMDYGDKVLRSEVFEDPPERGVYGYAYLPLKEGAEPKRQKPFVQFGEKNEALKKVTQEWLDKKFIEKPTGRNCEWLSQAFVVPKKSDTFP